MEKIMIFFRLSGMNKESVVKRILILGLVLTMTRCYYDNEETLYPGICNSENVTYKGFVRPFLDVNCTCHVKGSKNGNISLDNYAETQTYISNGQMLRSIKHESGVSPMPPSTPRRSSCDISKLESWVAGGAQDN